MSITKFLLFVLDTGLAIFIKIPIMIGMVLFGACFLSLLANLIDFLIAA